MTTIFKTPFATQGDKVSIPVEIQPDGSVSYTQGYGYDYERDQVTDPAAKDIEREKMNGIFHDITEAIGEIQSFGFPKWDEAGKPYAIRAIVYHKNKVWQSKVENNNIEPVAGNAWAELKADATAGEVGAYSKGESDQRFQPLGNYTPSGYSYSKAETDNKYQPKGNYAPAGNYANKGDSYTKTESDGRYQAKGNYQPSGDYATNTALNSGLNNKFDKSNVTQSTGTSTVHVMSQKASTDAFQPKGSYQPSGNYALVGASYTKTESDGRYQAKGSYATAGSSYTKAESDGRYQGKGNYQPAGNYALVGASYTKTESDGKYQLKGNYQASGYSYSKTETDTKYQPKGNYATAGSSYTKAESDGRYQKKGTGQSFRKIWSGNSWSTGGSITVSEDVRGKTIYIKGNGNRYLGGGGQVPNQINVGIVINWYKEFHLFVVTSSDGKTLRCDDTSWGIVEVWIQD
ncbi:hypothetical protein [Proteus terrae]|uniref:hypothetical protein n=1 Tax=Proteus terrae TaxID=1574161 RepID=UPI000D68FC80|nr:hypothetical protein [Proteus terrae]MCE9841099.1 hypothetical protein [Proteus terrae]MCT8262540.1 hypothetical protein [Proteus terrae]MDR9740639.1 hypothetical protein [Proteus terrae]WCG91662.1 hypothetical protein ONR67_06440 [Proteus terrae]